MTTRPPSPRAPAALAGAERHGSAARAQAARAGAHPLVWGAAAVAVLAALGGRDERAAPAASTAPAAPASAGPTAGMAVPCGRGALPDGADCVPIPPRDAPRAGAREPAARGWPEDEKLPRRPDRPADYAAYLWPLSVPGKPLRVAAETSLGARADGVYLRAETGRTAHVVDLEGQEGQAEVVFVTELTKPPIGATQRPVAVATKHARDEGGRPQTYLVVYDHLDHAGAGVVTGARLSAGDVVGVAADDAEGEGSELYVEVRKLRDGADVTGMAPARMLEPAVSLACDPRNVMPTE